MVAQIRSPISNIILWEKECGKHQGAPDSTYILVNREMGNTAVRKFIELVILANIIVLR